MAQNDKYIDVSRSFFVTDPKSVFENLRYTPQEDNPEKSPPIVAYEGYNFIPTSYGYRSYFGANSKLQIDTLTSRCDELFIYQLGNYKNIIIALCEDGLWYTASTTLAGADWIHGITLTVPAVGVYKEWTYCIIENNLYIYRQGEPTYWKVTPIGFVVVPAPLGITLTITAVTPTFLNMAGQLGIFRANASLGFWDSMNSISWSSPLAHNDFIPSLTTLAGNSIFSGLLGKIVTIKSQGDNFIVYTTKGIVGVRYIVSSTVQWEATTISDTAGISSSKEVVTGVTEMEHYAYTNTGFKRVGAYNALNKIHSFEEIITEIYDLLRENGSTVSLDFINGRYLFISLIDNGYINGEVSVEIGAVASLPVNILVNGVPYDGLSILPKTIGGTSLEQQIASEISAGGGSSTYTDGMFLEWRGSGVGSFSILETPMHEYVIDGKGNYIPNKKTDIGPCFQANGDALTASVGAYVTLSTPTFPDQWDNLGYRSYGSLANGIAMLGAMESGLASFRGAQLAEWNNFITIQGNNLAEIESIPNSPTITTQGTTQFLGLTEAQDYIDAQLKSLSTPGSTKVGNSITYIDADFGSFLSGAGTTLPEVFSGIGTNSASYNLTRNFSGGYHIRRMKTRVYSTRVLSNAGLRYYAGIGVTGAAWKKYYGTTLSVAPALAKCAAWVPPAVLTSANSEVSPELAGHTCKFVYTAYWGGDLMGHYYQYFNDTTGAPYNPAFFNFRYPLAMNGNTSSWTGNESVNFYAVDYTEYAYIDSTSEVMTATKSLTASQSNLTWGTATLTNPSPNSNYPLNDPTGQLLIPGISIIGGVISGGNFSYSYPGADFLLQDGVPSPIYPTYVGALVLDTALKKWGKMKFSYRALLDYTAFNSVNNNITSYSNLGVDIAALDPTGNIYNMDSHPADSWMRYGKIGYSRLGMTRSHEIRAHFRQGFTGSITLDTSMDGVAIDSNLSNTTVFLDVYNANCFVDTSGKWHTVKISGNYDLQYLEFRGTISGRR